MKRLEGCGLVLGLTLALAIPMPARATEQATPAADHSISATVVLDNLAEPCAGIRRIAFDLGMNPLGMRSTLRDRFLLDRAHTILLPVLAEVAATPELADDPTALAQKLRDQFQATARGQSVLFGSEQARDAWLTIEEAARRGAEGRQAIREAIAAETTPPAVPAGLLFLATLRDNRQLWERWESAALLGQFGGYRCPEAR